MSHFHPKGVLIDTNVLLALEQSSILQTLHEQYPMTQLCVVEGTAAELRMLERQGNGKEKRSARLALQLIKEQRLNTLEESDGYVDTVLLRVAKEQHFAILTLDRELQKRAKSGNIPTLTLRNGSVITQIH